MVSLPTFAWQQSEHNWSYFPSTQFCPNMDTSSDEDFVGAEYIRRQLMSPLSRRVSNGNTTDTSEPTSEHDVPEHGEETSKELIRRGELVDANFNKNRSFIETRETPQEKAPAEEINQGSVDTEQQTSFSMSGTNVEEEEDHSGHMEQKNITREMSAEEEEKEQRGKEKEKQADKEDKKPEKGPSKDDEDEDDDDEEEDEDDRSSHQIPTEGVYDPNEFINLPVGSDVKELFQFISAYTPQVIEIDTILKPFILDYIPAVGDIDAFIKIPRPDDVEDNLGLAVLDEPCAKQSDPTVLDLHLRATSKDAVPKGTVVKKLARADRNSKDIENWIKSIGELHKSKPATQVHYSKPMPDIDTLMQEWPTEVEDALKQIDLPSADLEQMPLEQYVDAACAILDIPIYKSRIQSLHVLFTLYSEFKNSQHFRALAEENRIDNAITVQKESDYTDRLEL